VESCSKATTVLLGARAKLLVGLWQGASNVSGSIRLNGYHLQMGYTGKDTQQQNINKVSSTSVKDVKGILKNSDWKNHI